MRSLPGKLLRLARTWKIDCNRKLRDRELKDQKVCHQLVKYCTCHAENDTAVAPKDARRADTAYDTYAQMF